MAIMGSRLAQGGYLLKDEYSWYLLIDENRFMEKGTGTLVKIRGQTEHSDGSILRVMTYYAI